MERIITPGDCIQTAVDAANEGDELILTEGVYVLTEPVQIRNRRNIRITGRNAVLTGSIPVKGEWGRYDENIFMLNTSPGLDIQQLFINGRKYIMARYPNEDRTRRLYGYSADSTSKGRAALWKDPSTGYVRGLHSCEWGGNDYFIDGRDEKGELILRWVGDNNRGSGCHAEFRFVENIFEELDSPGEWFYDRRTGNLYVYPLPGDDLGASETEAAVCGEMFMITGCENISVAGFTVRNTKRMLFCSQYEKITRSDWCVARNGAVYITGCCNITIAGTRFSEVGGNCIFIDGKNRDITVQDCDFTDCGASGVCVFGDQSAVRDLSTWEDHHTVISDCEPGPKNDLYPKDIKVKDCYFRDLGIYEKQSSAVSASVSSRVTVDGCTIHNMPRAGINICDGSFGGHRITDNLVFDTVLETGDHGPFNSWGRDRFWSLDGYDTDGRNGIKKRRYATLDAVETTVIAHNMFCGTKGFGIDLDDGSSNYSIVSNYCVGVGIKLREGFLRSVRNNYIVNAPLDLHCTFDNNDDVIENNIVFSEHPLNIYAPNRMFTTRAVNNLFAGADVSILSDELFRDNRNYICDIDDPFARSMNPREIWFEPFSLEFGRKDRPRPLIGNRATGERQSVKTLGAVLTDVDDSVRSMAGLPDFHGAFIEEITEDSPLYMTGARKHDVILNANGQDIKTPADMTDLKGVDSLHIVRAQKHISF